MVYMGSRPNLIFAAGLTAVIIVLQLLELYRLARRPTANLRGSGISKILRLHFGFQYRQPSRQKCRDLNMAFNELLKAFRKQRTEQEEHLAIS